MGSFWDYFLFYGLAGFYTAWLEGIYYLLVQDSFRFSPEFQRQFQYILSRQLLSWNPALLLRPEFGIRSPSSHGDLCPENYIFYPYFHWRKGCYFCFRVLANHLASFFFLYPVRRFVRTAISSTRVRLRSTDSLTYILYFLQQAGRSWPTFLIPLLTVSLSRPVNSNTEG